MPRNDGLSATVDLRIPFDCPNCKAAGNIRSSALAKGHVCKGCGEQFWVRQDGSISFKPPTKAELEALYRPNRILGEKPPNPVIALIGRVLEKPATRYPVLAVLILILGTGGWWLMQGGIPLPTGLAKRSEFLAAAWAANEPDKARALAPGARSEAVAWFAKSRDSLKGKPWTGPHRGRVLAEDRKNGAGTSILEFFRRDQNMESDKPAMTALIRWKYDGSDWVMDVPGTVKALR